MESGHTFLRFLGTIPLLSEDNLLLPAWSDRVNGSADSQQLKNPLEELTLASW